MKNNIRRSKSGGMFFKKILPALMLILALTLFSSCGIIDPDEYSPAATSELTGENLMRVSFIDVGQGDAAFVEFPGGKCMLIDAGESEEAQNITRYIDRLGYKKIDYLVLTHPHSDHMGGMAKILQSYEIGVFYMTNAVSNTVMFEEILDIVDRVGITVKQSFKGVNITVAEGIKVNFLSPCLEEYDDLNDYSSVLKITYNERSFLITGDAKKKAEEQITMGLSSDVVKVGHHGSNTSSSEDFVRRTHAKYAVVSVGMGNSYGHPHVEVLERWEKFGAEILRTDIHGNIVFTTDGESLYLKKDKEAGENGEFIPPPDHGTSTPDLGGDEPTVDTSIWVLNTKTRKIHKPACSTIPNMNEENREFSKESIYALLSKGYTTCGMCKPEEE